MDFPKTRRRKTFGLAVRRLEYNNTFTFELWKEVFARARDSSANLFLIQGRAPDLDRSAGWAETAVYRMLGPGFLDGLILTPTVLGHLSPDRFRQFLGEIPEVPRVTTAVGGTFLPWVQIDDQTGLRQLMRHLIEVHGCRKIIHIRGPVPHPQAVTRESVWRDELLRAGIVPDDRWVVAGHFDSEKIDHIGADLMAQTGGVFDAVVACNDTAALRVIRDLADRGYRVPEDYLVCGFDDTSRCQFSPVPLTTVSQNIPGQARAAWDHLEAQAAGAEPPTLPAIESRLVVRASCGCPREHWTPGSMTLLDHAEEALAGSADYQTAQRLTGERAASAAVRHSDRSQAEKALYDLSQFLGALNLIHETDQLPDLLRIWLPRLGIGRFAVFRSCGADGVATNVPLERRPEVLLPQGPRWLVPQILQPMVEEPPQAVAADRLGLHPWFAAVEPFELGVFPLAMESSWYGLAFFELTQETGLVPLTVQELLISVFDRIEREKVFIEKNTEERTRARVERDKTDTLTRFVTQVAHEINTPLGAISSCNSSLHAELVEFLGRGHSFYTTLSPAGRPLYEELLVRVTQGRPEIAPRQRRLREKEWTEALGLRGCTEPGRTAEALSVIGFPPGAADLDALVLVPDYEAIVDHLSRLADLLNATRVIAAATEKATAFVDTLRRNGNPGRTRD